MVDSPITEVLIATGNPGKIREIQEAVSGIPIRWRYLHEFHGITTVEETGKTYEENAILKAIGYSKQTGLCALADDSGLEVDALRGLPGVRSARYGGEGASDLQRTEKLLLALAGWTGKDRKARFVCHMAFAGWSSPEAHRISESPLVLHVSEGTCEGLIGERPIGKEGFGYDPIFIPEGYTETFGQLRSEVKMVISHRALALAAMRAFLVQWLAKPSSARVSSSLLRGSWLT